MESKWTFGNKTFEALGYTVQSFEALDVGPLPEHQLFDPAALSKPVELEMTFTPFAVAVWLRMELASVIDFSEADLEAIRNPWN